MKYRNAVMVSCCLLAVYILLALFNTLYWTAGYEDNTLVRFVGGLTDGEVLEVVWIPGQIISFFLSVMVDADAAIIGSILTLIIGVLVILNVAGFSWRRYFRKDTQSQNPG